MDATRDFINRKLLTLAESYISFILAPHIQSPSGILLPRGLIADHICRHPLENSKKESEFWFCPSQNFQGSHFRQDKIQTPLVYQGSFPARPSARLSADPRVLGLRMPLGMDPRRDAHRSAVSQYYNVTLAKQEKVFRMVAF